MSKSKDFISLGEAYKDVFSKVVVSEDVPAGTTGEAPLTKGGPEKEGGFREPLVDITKMSEKDKKDNIYNVKGYSYGDGNDPGDCQEPHPTGPDFANATYTGNVGPEEDEEEKGKRPDYPDVDGDKDTDESMEKALKDKKKGKKDKEAEEDEEFLKEHEKIARNGLNNFMSKTSVFDKLYNKVMVNENFGEDQEDITDIEALGIETDDEGGDDGDTVTITISKACCEELHKACEGALGGGEEAIDIDIDEDENTFGFEEDEEAVDAGSTLNHTVDMGHGSKNKVGSLKTKGAAKDKDGGGYSVDAGSTLNHTVDMGKDNKVGDLKSGSSAFE
jgi:hypothetical protein